MPAELSRMSGVPLRAFIASATRLTASGIGHVEDGRADFITGRREFGPRLVEHALVEIEKLELRSALTERAGSFEPDPAGASGNHGELCAQIVDIPVVQKNPPRRPGTSGHPASGSLFGNFNFARVFLPP